MTETIRSRLVDQTFIIFDFGDDIGSIVCPPPSSSALPTTARGILHLFNISELPLSDAFNRARGKQDPRIFDLATGKHTVVGEYGEIARCEEYLTALASGHRPSPILAIDEEVKLRSPAGDLRVRSVARFHVRDVATRMVGGRPVFFCQTTKSLTTLDNASAHNALLTLLPDIKILCPL